MCNNNNIQNKYNEQYNYYIDSNELRNYEQNNYDKYKFVVAVEKT